MKSLDEEVTLNEWQKDKLQHHIQRNTENIFENGKSCTNSFQRMLSLFLETTEKKECKWIAAVCKYNCM